MKFCDKCHSTYPGDFATCPKDQAKLRDVSELMPGMVLRGKYKVEEKIGEGGMATVYRASHQHFNEELAIKVVSSALSNNQEFLDRFKREAVITRKLRHPNAVRLDDFDITEDGRPFIAMEYVRGKSLRQVLQEKGNLPVPRAFNIASQVARALGAAHKLGIVHRDIKPDNVLLVRQSDGTDLVKVLDFGIAKVTGEDLKTDTGYKPTSTGMVLGTPHYLSPEQARGKKSGEIDGRSDLYAVGVMLYEMVTGELPFKSDTAIEMLLHHIQTAPVPTHLLKPEMKISEQASALIMKALAKDPGERFQSGEEMAEALANPGAVPIEGPQKTPAGGSIAAFSTAAMAAAAAPATERAQAATAAVKATTAASELETRALGSASFTVQTPKIAASLARVAATIQPKKSKRWLIWSGAAVAVIALAIWIGSFISSRNAEQPAAQQPVYQQPETREPRRSERRPTRRNEPTSESRASQPAVSEAAQRARAQQLVLEGNARLARRDFSGAQSDFQQALELDPNNAAAQHGMQVAQAGAVAQGLGSILHR